MTHTPGAERPGPAVVPSSPPFTVGVGDDYRDPDIYGPNAGLDVDPEHPTPGAPAGEPTDLVYGGPRRETLPEDLDDGDDTPLEELRAEVNSAVLPTTTLPIPSRPGWSATFRIDVRSPQIDSWRKRAKRGKNVDPTMFAALCVAELNTGITRHGRPVRLEGAEQTFRDRAYMDAMSTDDHPAVRRAVDAVLKTYGLEGHVDATARAVLVAAGWGDEVEDVGDEGPTS